MRVVDATGKREDGAAWGLPGALLLHAPLIAAIALVPIAAPMRPAPITSIVVELLAAPLFEAARSDRAAGPPAPAATPATLNPPAPVGPAPAPPVPDGGAADAPSMVRPRTMLSAAVLADPHNRQATAALAGMDGGERLIQLCNIEAMSQIHGWRAELEPDHVVAYATADVVVAGATVSATGAAFRSRHRWFELQFRCEAAAGGTGVTAFEFLVGKAIPKARWEEFSLPDDTDGEVPDD